MTSDQIIFSNHFLLVSLSCYINLRLFLFVILSLVDDSTLVHPVLFKGFILDIIFIVINFLTIFIINLDLRLFFIYEFFPGIFNLLLFLCMLNLWFWCLLISTFLSESSSLLWSMQLRNILIAFDSKALEAIIITWFDYVNRIFVSFRSVFRPICSKFRHVIK